VKRTIALSALVAGTLLSAGSLTAQSDNRGFMLNLHLLGNGVSTVGADAEMENGGGLGVALGYGFNDRVALYLNIDGAEIEYDEDVETDEDSYTAVTADIGARMNFGNEGMKLRPYINAAFSGLVLGEEGDFAGEELTTMISGGGLTVGGGLQYFFSQNLALDVGLQATQGAFTDIAVDDEDEELDEGIAYTTSRIQLGVTWHP
jgi:opacity protein-like surface antigen